MGRALSNRLAVFLPSLSGGGAERAYVRLASGMAAKGRQVDLVLARAQGPCADEIGSAVRVVDLACSRVLTSVLPLARYLRAERPRALMSTLDYANLAAIFARRIARTPCTLVINDQNMITITAARARQQRQRVVPVLARRLYQQADHVVGNSQGVAADLRRVLPSRARDVRVIHNPIVVPGMRARADVAPLHPWLVPGSQPVVLAIGRLTVQKDFATLLHAFARVRRERASRLVILGEGPDRPVLELLARGLGVADDVLMPGFVSNPYGWLARASVFVLSSQWEGLPTVVVEALFCGVPVVATDCPSGPREILEGGRHGVLVPVQDAGALASAISRALAGGVPRPGPESWQPYALDTIVGQYLELVERTS